MKILTYFHVLWTSTQDKNFSFSFSELKSRAKGRNIVGWYILRSFAHAVACCLGVAAQSLKRCFCSLIVDAHACACITLFGTFPFRHCTTMT